MEAGGWKAGTAGGGLPAAPATAAACLSFHTNRLTILLAIFHNLASVTPCCATLLPSHTTIHRLILSSKCSTTSTPVFATHIWEAYTRA
jgi:hypothetical protein